MRPATPQAHKCHQLTLSLSQPFRSSLDTCNQLFITLIHSIFMHLDPGYYIMLLGLTTSIRKWSGERARQKSASRLAKINRGEREEGVLLPRMKFLQFLMITSDPALISRDKGIISLKACTPRNTNSFAQNTRCI